jgi:hypothetical protein
MKFRKKSIVVEATQWFKNGDHPEDDCVVVRRRAPGDPDDIRRHTGDFIPDPVTGHPYFLTEGKVVRYFRRPDINGRSRCVNCDRIMNDHGWIDCPNGGITVCPGDWVITDPKGGYYTCQKDIFSACYDSETDLLKLGALRCSPYNNPPTIISCLPDPEPNAS